MKNINNQVVFVSGFDPTSQEFTTDRKLYSELSHGEDFVFLRKTSKLYRRNIYGEDKLLIVCKNFLKPLKCL